MEEVESHDDGAGRQGDKKRMKRALVATLVDAVKARKYARAFPGESFVERKGKLFCGYCNHDVPFDTKAAVRQHLHGQRTKGLLPFDERSEKEKRRIGHQAKKVDKLAAAAAKGDLKIQMERNRELLWAHDRARDDVAPPRGAHVPAENQADRVTVLETLWHVGIPVNNLRNARFLQLVEQPHVALGGVEGVRRVIPFAQTRALDAVKVAVKDRRVAVFIDGTKANFLVEGVVARFVDDKFNVRQMCIGVAAIAKSLNTDSLMLLLRKHLADVGLEHKNLIGVMSDCGQPNPAAMKKWNELAHEMGQPDETILWVPCLMHAASNVGLTLRKQLPAVKLFMSGYKKMSNESEAARQLWQDKTGEACKHLSDKSFWRWWDCIRGILNVQQHVGAFIREAVQRKVSKKSVAKMEEACKNPLLFAQMHFCIAAGQIFRDMGVLLEGDGFCLPFVHKHVSAAQDFYAMFPRLNRAQAAQHHLIAPIVDPLRLLRGHDARVADLPTTLYDVASAVAVHADSSILQGMASILPLYRAGSLLHPLRFLAEANRADFRPYLITAIEQLTSLKGIKAADVTQLKVDLNAQLIAYQRACRDRARHLAAAPQEDTPPALWTWWVSVRMDVPAWFSVAKILVLLQPTSAAIERFFSYVKANTSPLQHNESREVFAARCMSIYNDPPG